jgi:GxxExxY protein
VHTILGPGFLERIYEDALCHELALRQVPFERQKTISASSYDHQKRPPLCVLRVLCGKKESL